MGLGVRVPFYQIIVNGKDLSDDIYAKITKVTFKEPEDGEQYFVISMADHNYSIQDSGTFVADKTVCTLYMGYLDDYDHMMDGIVQGIKADYPKSDSPTLEITVKNISAIMNREQKNVRHINKTYSDIVIDICKLYGLKHNVDDTKYLFNPAPTQSASGSPVTVNPEPELKVGATVHMKGNLFSNSYGGGKGAFRDVDVVIQRIVDTSRATPYYVSGGWIARSAITSKASAPVVAPPKTTKPIKQESIYQTGQSDYEFCRAMAKKIGYKFYIDGAVVYFKKGMVTHSVDLEYRVGENNLISFTPNVNTTNTGHAYKSSNIDFNKKAAPVIANKGTQTNVTAPTATAKTAQQKPAQKVHIVKSGEYLIKIAKQYYGDGSKYKDIYSANTDKIKMPGYIVATGSKLVIP